jgi:hypothetical protein
MKDPLKTGFTDRLTAAAEAKKAMLARMKPKPTVTDPNFVDRATRKAEELAAKRALHEAEKEKARLESEARKALEAEAAREAEEAALEAKRGERKERKALTKAEAKAKRDARYAARKARQ